MASENRYDAIVIGSGIGGLATASLLAQIGRQRVLVLESHFKLGGFLHSFSRGDYTWDPGVHYIGEMQAGSLTRQCMDLVTGGAVRWNKMSSPFETMVFPEGTFAIPSDPVEFREQLIAKFPNESTNIKRYFRDLRTTKKWLERWYASKQFPSPLAALISIGRKLPHSNTRDYFQARFDDTHLQAILMGQWPDYGTPPDESAFGVHAAIAADYLHGGWYPIGGSQQIVACAVAKIREAGGNCLPSHPVQNILIRNNRALGVRVENKGETQEYFAPRIISNASARTTFQNLVPEKWGADERAKARRIQNGTSSLVLFLGLREDPRNQGFSDTNYWLYRSSDHRRPVNGSTLAGAYLSFGSLRNPELTSHTAQIISLCGPEEWSRFSSTKWKQRGAEYENLKDEKTRELIAFADERLPGFRDLIAYSELATPLTIKTFTGHPDGAIYGHKCDVNRLTSHSWSIATSIKNLFLTGTDLGVPGVNSGLMIGVMTAGKIIGWRGMPSIFAAARRQASSGDPPR